MKSILTLATLAIFITAPALAADQSHRLTKGSKSYQSSQNWNNGSKKQTTANTAQPQQAGDVSQIEPAAGGNSPAEVGSGRSQNPGKSFREDMRLPRKN